MSRIEDIKKRAKNDLYFFCREVLGYTKMSPNPHQELCNVITDDSKRRKLILMPRGSFKSSVLTVGSSLWNLVRNPNERILITHELQKNANKYVTEIKNHIEGNPKFRALFGNLVGKEIWRHNEFLINSRTRIYKEPSVMSASLEKGVTVGLHFNRIILDDPVSNQNSKTLDQVEKTIEFYKLVLSVLEPDGHIYVIGTRWNMNDLYGWILDDDNPESKKFHTIVKRAMDSQGNYLMPDVLTPSFLEDVKETQGEDIFSHQYLNQPMSSKQACFDEKDIQFFTKPAYGVNYFLTVDCAISTSKDADYTAFVMNGVDWDHNYYIVEARRIKAKPSEIVEEIFRMISKYQPFMNLGIETSMADQAVKELLFVEMEKRECWFAVTEIREGSRKSKEERIKWLQPKFKSKKIFLKKDQQELINEIKFYPQVRHDDLLDALKSQVKITFPSDKHPVIHSKLDKLPDKQRQIWEHLDSLKHRKVRRKRFRRV